MWYGNITQIVLYCSHLTSFCVLTLGSKWKDNIKTGLKDTEFVHFDRIHQAEDRDGWRPLVNTAMNVRTLPSALRPPKIWHTLTLIRTRQKNSTRPVLPNVLYLHHPICRACENSFVTHGDGSSSRLVVQQPSLAPTPLSWQTCSFSSFPWSVSIFPPRIATPSSLVTNIFLSILVWNSLKFYPHLRGDRVSHPYNNRKGEYRCECRNHNHYAMAISDKRQQLLRLSLCRGIWRIIRSHARADRPNTISYSNFSSVKHNLFLFNNIII